MTEEGKRRRRARDHERYLRRREERKARQREYYAEHREELLRRNRLRRLGMYERPSVSEDVIREHRRERDRRYYLRKKSALAACG